jgi:uncharacterized protein YegP (UPF0339 family)
MQKVCYSLVFFFLFLGVKAQQTTQEFTLNLNSKCWLKKHAYSQKIELADTLNYGFLGLSAFTKDTSVAVVLEYRAKQTKEWGPWVKMATPHEGRPLGRQSFNAPPIFDKIDALQIRASDSLDEPLILRLFIAPVEKKSPNPKLELSTLGAQGQCFCPLTTVCVRSCWCPNNQCPPPAQYTTTSPTHLIVHHSAGFTNYNDYNWVVAYYWDLHVNTNGWDDIGYNWLVDPNGVIYEGRGSGNRGAHFSCMNEATVGICLIGNYETHATTNAGLNALLEILTYESCQQGINPVQSSLHNCSQLVLKHVSGHLDGNSSTQGCPKGTACPGQNLYPLLDSLAQTVAQNPCLGLNQRERPEKIARVYPNPSHKFFKIELATAGHYQWRLLSTEGKVLRAGRFRGSETEIHHGQNSGLYLLEISGAHHQSTLKITVP